MRDQGTGNREQKNSDAMKQWLVGSRNRESDFCDADVFVAVPGADGDEMFAELKRGSGRRDENVVVLTARVGDVANGLNVLPGAGVDGVLGAGEGRECVFGVEGEVDLQRALATAGDEPILAWEG